MSQDMRFYIECRYYKGLSVYIDFLKTCDLTAIEQRDYLPRDFSKAVQDFCDTVRKLSKRKTSTGWLDENDDRYICTALITLGIKQHSYNKLKPDTILYRTVVKPNDWMYLMPSSAMKLVKHLEGAHKYNISVEIGGNQ